MPGLPLSYLDHNLRRGNSLVGVVGEEVLAALRPDTATLEGDWISEQLAAAVEQAKEAVERVYKNDNVRYRLTLTGYDKVFGKRA